MKLKTPPLKVALVRTDQFVMEVRRSRELRIRYAAPRGPVPVSRNEVPVSGPLLVICGGTALSSSSVITTGDW